MKDVIRILQYDLDESRRIVLKYETILKKSELSKTKIEGAQDAIDTHNEIIPQLEKAIKILTKHIK